MSPIYFNGKAYNDISEMPTNERQAYEQLMAIFKDANHDGIPDIFQGDVIGNLVNATTTSIHVDGVQVNEADAMTPEMRAKFEEGMKVLENLGFTSQVPTVSASSQAPQAEHASIHPSPPVIQQPSAIQEEQRNRWLWVLLALVILVACGIGTAIFFVVLTQAGA